MDPRAITTPRDCGVALAVPLDRAAFLRDLASSRKQYARFYRGGNGGDSILPQKLWEEYERGEAAPIRAFVAEARALGAEAVPDCTLAGLVGLLRRKRVVVVAAHWRDGRLGRADIRNPAGLCSRLRTERGGALEALRSRLSQRCLLELERIGSPPGVTEDFLHRLLTEINAALAAGLLLPGPHDIGVAPSPPIYYVDRNRAVLVEAYPELIEDSVGLELSDGTWSAALVCEAVGHDFDGLLDLSVCHSVLLAEEIKHASPHCAAMANQEMTAPGVRLLIVREVLRLLARTPGSYLQVALAVRAAMRGT